MSTTWPRKDLRLWTAAEVLLRRGPSRAMRLREGKLFVRQKPGPKNALGLATFLFPNSYNVYMHDTPATEFFAKSRRDFSHGCIRLEKPADLAAWVLRDNPGWNPGRYSRGDERQRASAGESCASDSGLDGHTPLRMSLTPLIDRAACLVLHPGAGR